MIQVCFDLKNQNDLRVVECSENGIRFNLLLSLLKNVNSDDYYFIHNCKYLSFDEIVQFQNGALIIAVKRCLGGKGGYGNLLKKKGKEFVKIDDNNFENVDGCKLEDIRRIKNLEKDKELEELQISIKEIFGSDKYKNKKMTSMECADLYNIKLPRNIRELFAKKKKVTGSSEIRNVFETLLEDKVSDNQKYTKLAYESHLKSEAVKNFGKRISKLYQY